jgi:hypothetical protein
MPVAPAPGPLPRHPRIRRPGSLGLGLLPALLLPLAAALPARAAETAVVQEILDGTELYIDQRQARVKEKATAPQQLSTQNSRGQIAFDSGAVGRINRFSQLKLGQGCFLISKGQILVSGRQSGCTRSARLSVRGTNYLIDVGENGESELSVLEGSVEVEALKEGEPTGKPATTVQAGQKVRLSPEGVILALLGLSTADYNSILSGPLFKGFRLPLPAWGKLESYLRGNVPGVRLPSLPISPPVPIGLPGVFPRLF